MSTVEENVDALEKRASEYIKSGHAVAPSTGTAVLHLAVKLSATKACIRPREV